MLTNQLSFEEIDAIINSAEATAVTPEDIIQKICKMWKPVKPIIAALLSFPIPKKWKDVLNNFATLLDLLCPNRA